MSTAGSQREIERKFLVRDDRWRAAVERSVPFVQGYLTDAACPGNRCSVRVRIEGEAARLNIKSMEIGVSRDEYEYPLPVSEAQRMLATLAAGPVIRKVRHWVRYAGFVWEIDVFEGDNAGLVVAEVELPDERTEPPLPPWIGREVTHEQRYYNVALAQRPYCEWSEDEKQDA